MKVQIRLNTEEWVMVDHAARVEEEPTVMRVFGYHDNLIAELQRDAVAEVLTDAKEDERADNSS